MNEEDAMLFRMMFVVFAFAVLVISATGCGNLDRQVAKYTGNATMCVDGVKYIRFESGASVMYNPDGTIKKC